MIIVKLYMVNGPSPLDGQYLRRYDPESHDGRGNVVLTANRACALRFADMAEVLAVWRVVPKARRRRPDGKPNRPLTAYHLETETL